MVAVILDRMMAVIIKGFSAGLEVSERLINNHECFPAKVITLVFHSPANNYQTQSNINTLSP